MNPRKPKAPENVQIFYHLDEIVVQFLDVLWYIHRVQQLKNSYRVRFLERNPESFDGKCFKLNPK